MAFRAGRAAFPEVRLDREGLFAHLESVAVSTTGAAEHGADLYLAAACRRNDPAALRYFDGILQQCRGALRRYSAGEEFDDEVLQRVRIHLLIADGEGAARIGVYDGRASLRTWLGVCTVRMALYLQRGRRTAREVATDWPEVIAALPVGDPELAAVRAQYAAVFGQAWRGACTELSARHRVLLRMCFVEGHPIEQVAAAYAVHRVTVWRWLEEAKKRLLDGTRARLAALLPADGPGTQSLLALVGSQLELGLSQLEALSAPAQAPRPG